MGGYISALGNLGNMFDMKYGKENGVLTGFGYYASQTCSEERGINVDFLFRMQYVDFVIHTRRNCCADRYNNVCLYSYDGEGPKRKVACTPANFGDQGPEGVIHMRDFNVDSSEVFGTKLHLRFEDNRGGDDDCAAIEELIVYYKEIISKNILLPS